MSSWREGLSDEAKAEMDRVLDTAVNFAHRMLESEGSFHPFAVRLTVEDETEMVTAPAGASDPLRALLDGLVGHAALLKSAAVVANVRLDSISSDAVRLDMEHRDGAALTVVVPYTRRRLRKRVEMGELQAMTVAPRIWGP